MFQNWLYIFTGYGISERPIYKLYKALLIVFYIYMAAMALYNVLLLGNDNMYIMFCYHFTAVCFWDLNTLCIRLLTHRPFKRISEIIKEGIYFYEDEDSDEFMKIKMSLTKDLVLKTRIVKTVYMTAYIMVMFVSPILFYLYVTEDSKFYQDEIVNVYLPHIFYVPFDTRTALGYSLAYGIDLIFWTYTATTTIVVISLIMSIGLQASLHLRILNYSLRTVHGRAVRLYRKHFSPDGKDPPGERILQSKEFQECLYSCLRANIRHHQALKMFKECFHPFVGPVLLALYSPLLAVLYAALIYLILQPFPFSLKLKFFFLLASEETSSAFVSLAGEDILNESSNVFQELYNTPWFKYNKKFKQTLHIMMTFTLKPMSYKAIFFSATASMESFGELVKLTYSVLNLVGPSKKLDL